MKLQHYLGGLDRYRTVERNVVGQCDPKRRGDQPGHTQRQSLHNHDLHGDSPKRRQLHGAVG